MLDKDGLKSAIVAGFQQARTQTTDPAGAADALAGAIANAIDAYVKGIQVTYTTGLVAPSGGGAVTGDFEYQIS